ncbi:MAG: potassium transporter TrkG, partial [Eggerthellaceae bacterium]
MWQRFTLYDLRVIGHYLGMLALFSSLVLMVPFVTALACGEWEPAARYLLTIGIALIVGSGLRFLRIDPGRLNRQQALAVTGLAWIVLAFIATVPLHLSGHYASYLDALFDGVSGLTTTGASIILDLDHLSNADNMWRFMMHLIGGLGLIVVALSFGLFGRGAGSLYASEGRSEHVVPNVVQTARLIAKIAVVIILIATAILTGLCAFMGMEPLRAFLHALWLSISGFMTGGFAPMSQSVMYYHSFPIELLLMLLMLLGSINFMLHSEVWKGRVAVFFRDLETRTMVLWLGVMACVLAASLSASAEFSNLPAMLRRGLFMIIASFSTTGFQNITSNQMTTVFS